MRTVGSVLKNAMALMIFFLILCCVIYPLIVTGISQLAFSKQANGSLIQVNGETVGSELIGQAFTDNRFFKGRVSAVNYNTYTKEEADKEVASGSYNYGASSPKLKERVEQSIDTFLKENPDVKKEDIPTDLLTASASGLDPHISKKAAEIQVPAIAKATGLSEQQLKSMIKEHTQEKVLGIFGEETVNVLTLNLSVAKAIHLI